MLTDPIQQLEQMPRTFGELQATGDLRHLIADFQVTEILGFEPSGQGEHLFLYIEKQDLNSQDIVQLLSKFTGVHQKNIGLAGLKDKRAITRQFFSILTTGMKTVDWTDFNSDQVQILSSSPHLKKCRRGVLKANQFKIVVRHIKGDKTQIEQKFQLIKQQGFPNYFTAQRFGIQGRNLIRADQLFSEKPPRFKRQQKSFVYSAARSWIFNLILSERIKDHSWNQVKAGDLMNLAGTNQLFESDIKDPALTQRLIDFDIHPTGLLMGKEHKGRVSKADTEILENKVLEPFKHWQQGLIKEGVEIQRRPLRAVANDLEWVWQEDSLILTFELGKGSYATALLRELFLS